MVALREEFDGLKQLYMDGAARLDYIHKKLQVLNHKRRWLEEREKSIDKARAIVQDVAFQTQKNLEFHVSNIVTTAIKHVNAEWPDYVVEFVKRRNKTECDLLFEENNKKQAPTASAGGGATDIASFAQLISYWTLRKNLPTFFLDEPFRNVSPDLQHRVSEMLEMVCTKLKLQIIMVSHADDINIAARRTFVSSKVAQVAQVEEGK